MASGNKNPRVGRGGKRPNKAKECYLCGEDLERDDGTYEDLSSHLPKCPNRNQFP